VPVKTYETWATELRKNLISGLPKRYNTDTQPAVTRLKKNPAMIAVLDAYVAECEQDVRRALESVEQSATDDVKQLLRTWDSNSKQPLAHRLHSLTQAVEHAHLPTASRNVIQRSLRQGRERVQNLVAAWIDVLTDTRRIRAALATRPEAPLSERELERALDACRAQCDLIWSAQEHHEERKERAAKGDDDEQNFQAGVD